jgi:hypothetical protein
LTSAAQEVLALLKRPSDRDQQVTVGPSSLGNLCTYCLAHEMLATEASVLGKYWLGARIGTAIHLDLEQQVKKYRPETEPEQRVTIGNVKGYGVIKGTADWFVEPDVRDFKTTTQDKLRFIKRAIAEPPDQFELSKVTEARFKVEGYWNQAHLYAYGLAQTGRRVETCTLIFICRDGKTDDDIWSHSIPYERERAEKVLDRASRLWEYLSHGGDPEELSSRAGCYTCTVEGRV